ncbi:MAG: YicC/YloC family endoribonuclease [Burkholderiaceae bacterium]
MSAVDFTFIPGTKLIVTDKRALNGPAVQSMTGYSMHSDNAEPPVSVELRGVNSRFLDLVLRMPDDLRVAEPAIRDKLRRRLARGKVECRVNLQSAGRSATLAPDPAVLAGVKSALQVLQTEIPDLTQPSASELLNFPGLFEQAPQTEELQTRLLKLTDLALDDFIESRITEGTRLRELIIDRLNSVQKIVEALRLRAPELTNAYQTRLTERIRTALEGLPESDQISAGELVARVSQEVSVYGLRADVAEETDRLSAHVQECRERLSGQGPVGKRLDFLMQELNREANTLASKASAIDLTRAAVDLKVLIEQIREQVQNLE